MKSWLIAAQLVHELFRFSPLRGERQIYLSFYPNRLNLYGYLVVSIHVEVDRYIIFIYLSSLRDKHMQTFVK